MTTAAASNDEHPSSITEDLVDRLLAAMDRINDSDRMKARECLLDHLGVTLAGAAEMGGESASIRRFLGDGEGPARAIGTTATTDLLTAAWLNGMHAHKLELDDGHRFGMVHPGAPVISALLPLAQAKGLGTEALLRGIIAGYEVAVRLAMAVQPAMKHKGYHATGTCGAVGAAVGAAVALGLPRAQLLGTIAAACTQAAGLLEVIRDGSDLKPFNAGQAALHGIVAVTMGQAGAAGPRDVLGGRQGLLQLLSDAPRPEMLHAIGSAPFAIHGIYVKPYAACRHAHAPVEAALILREQHALRPDQVAGVQVRTYDLAVHLHDHRQVQGAADAKMSTPYSVAAALCAGEAGLAQFAEPWLNDPALHRIMAVVDVAEDAAMSAQVPQVRAARVDIALTDGRVLSHTVDHPKGEPENPIGREGAIAKFQGLAHHAGLGSERIDRIIALVLAPDGDLSAAFPHL